MYRLWEIDEAANFKIQNHRHSTKRETLSLQQPSSTNYPLQSLSAQTSRLEEGQKMCPTQKAKLSTHTLLANYSTMSKQEAHGS